MKAQVGQVPSPRPPGWSVAEAELGLGPAQALSRSCGSLPTCPFLTVKSE